MGRCQSKYVMCAVLSLGTVALVFCYQWTFLDYEPEYSPVLARSRPYLIDTPGYQLPDFDPFDPTVRKYIIDPPPYKCGNGKSLLTDIVYNADRTGSPLASTPQLVILKENFEEWEITTTDCCYSAITRGDDPTHPDFHYELEEECHMVNGNKVNISDEFIFVKCYYKGKIIYSYTHAIIQSKNTFYSEVSGIKPNDLEGVESPRSPTAKQQNNRGPLVYSSRAGYPSHPPLSVMLFGIDSISRLNLIRQMPKTSAFFKKMQAVDFLGYNKVADNTLPNLLPLLAGLPREQMKNYVNEKSDFFLDLLPILWKNFSRKGYLTALAEDCPSLGTFNYFLKGFKFKPTDYYMRPFVLASESLIGSHGNLAWIAKDYFCYGSKPTPIVMMDFARDVSEVPVGQPYFAFIWSARYSHDDVNLISLMDSPTYEFLKSSFEKNLWNNTILFFFSDHGFRFGPLRSTYIGKKEESLPMNMIVLPEWFKDIYPEATLNLMHNQHRLTTPYDFHVTLKDILYERYKNKDYVTRDNTLKEDPGMSLFRKIPATRTCSDANIPLKYCAGMATTPAEGDPMSNMVVEFAIKNLNQLLAKYPNCTQFEKYSLLRSRKGQFTKPIDMGRNLTTNYYEVVWETQPEKVELETIVKVHVTNNQTKFTADGEVSRLNVYEGQSNCIDDVILKKYCYCKDLMTK